MSRSVRKFSLFIMTVFSVAILSGFAAAKTVTQPIPLRVMYLKSHLVFIGTVSSASAWEQATESNGKTLYRRTLMINVESPIKGMASGTLAVTEMYVGPGSGGDIGAKSNFSAGAQRRLFFLGNRDNSYYVLSNFHGDFSLNNTQLDVYAARLRELQNIYLSGDRVKEQLMDWLGAVAADPVTRFDGAYDLKNVLESARCAAGLSTEAGPAIDPSGRPEGSGLDPNGRTDNGPCVDPYGRDAGSCIDPMGQPCSSSDAGSFIDPLGRDGGSCIDPNGNPCDVKGVFEGSGIDPHGRSVSGKGDDTSHLRP